MGMAAIALGLAYGMAALAWALTRRPLDPRLAASWAAAVIACASTVLFADDRLIRAVTIICGVIVALRVYSYCIVGSRGTLPDYLRFLSVGLLSPYLVYSSNRPKGSRASFIKEIARATVAGAAGAATWIAARYLIIDGPARESWVVNHVILRAAFVIVMTAFGQVNFALWRILRFRSRPLVDRIWLSRTPADFWRRWSWPIHLWLYEYVYLPAGGRRHGTGPVIAVFAVSGILHEIISFVAIGRLKGYQIAFFAVSAIGVLASPVLERIGKTGILGTAMMRTATILFLSASAVLMFRTIDLVIPLYAMTPKFMW